MKVVGTLLDMATATLVTTVQPETVSDYLSLGLLPPGWIEVTVRFRDEGWHDLRRWEDDGGRS